MNKQNHVVLEGIVSFDPKVKTTPQGFTVANVSMKCKYGKSGSLFIDVTVWNKNLIRVVEVTKKGDVIQVTGELKSSAWESPNGEKRVKHTVNAETFVPVKNRQSEAFEHPFND